MKNPAKMGGLHGQVIVFVIARLDPLIERRDCGVHQFRRQQRPYAMVPDISALFNALFCLSLGLPEI